DALQVVLERIELAIQTVEVDEHLRQGGVSERVIQTLARNPRTMGLGPGLLAITIDPPVAQKLLGDAVACRGPGAAQVIAAAHQIAQPLGLRGRCRHEGELAARNSRTSFFASRRSVFTRSPARTGTSDGATTSHATPIPDSSRSRSNPPGPAS